VHKKNSRPKEVANGTLGHVVGYQLPNDTTSNHQVIDESTGYTVTISSMLPDIVFVELLGREEIIDLELFLGIVGIHPILERNVAIQLPNQSFIVLNEQIPLDPTFALTIDKCHGLTLSRAILGPLLHPLQQIPKKNGIVYVDLSRAK
jgi:hypothetical protein